VGGALQSRASAHGSRAGFPDGCSAALVLDRHPIGGEHRVVVTAPILGGLHQEYRLELRAAGRSGGRLYCGLQGTRRILHWNVTEHPTAVWTAQQFRMLVSDDGRHRFLIHDHDTIYSDRVDRTVAAMGLTVLRTPVRSPQANAFCERVIGTLRREYLDWMIPLNERHLRRALQSRSSTREPGTGHS
jgi:hypothetical protein